MLHYITTTLCFMQDSQQGAKLHCICSTSYTSVNSLKIRQSAQIGTLVFDMTTSCHQNHHQHHHHHHHQHHHQHHLTITSIITTITTTIITSIISIMPPSSHHHYDVAIIMSPSSCLHHHVVVIVSPSACRDHHVAPSPHPAP